MLTRLSISLVIILLIWLEAQSIDTDGYLNVRKVVKLTDDKYYNHSPSWSPDGSKIAYCTRRDEDTDIFIIDLSIKEVILEIKSNDKDLSPKWHPKGEMIGYIREDSERNRSIWIYDTHNGENRKLIKKAGYYSNFSWSPGGDSLVYEGWINSEYVISIYNINTGEISDPIIKNGRWPIWSPDGEYIAFTRIVDNGYQVFRLRLEDYQEEQITRTNSDSWATSWSPDGEWLAYHSKEQAKSFFDFKRKLANWNIFLYNTKTGKKKQLTNNDLHSYKAVFSTDGKSLACYQGIVTMKSVQTNIYILELKN